MDIQKSKSWPAWRVMLADFVIVVLGVGVALAAQQAADWWHWQNEVKIARQAVTTEIANNSPYFALIVAEAPCLDRQISEAGAILTALEMGKKPPSFTAFHHEVGIYISDSEWESERSSQVLTHFPHAELALLNSYYGQIPLMRFLMGPMSETWSDLSILRDPPATLDRDRVVRLRNDLDRVRHLQAQNLFNALRILNISNEIGIPRPAPEPARSARYCRLNDEQLFDVITQAARQPVPKKP